MTLKREKKVGKSRFESLEDILGVSPATVAKLKEMGYSTIESLARASVVELTKAGISDKVAAKLISQAGQGIQIDFTTALDVLERRTNLEEEVTVTRKYQVTIPKRIRTKYGVKVGDKLIVREERGRIVIETPKKVVDPSTFLWNLSKKPLDVDVVKLVEESWEKI